MDLGTTQPDLKSPDNNRRAKLFLARMRNRIRWLALRTGGCSEISRRLSFDRCDGLGGSWNGLQQPLFAGFGDRFGAVARL
jgi:hypothetical protein